MSNESQVVDNSAGQSPSQGGIPKKVPTNRLVNPGQFGRLTTWPDHVVDQERRQRVLQLLAEAGAPRDRKQ